MREAKDGCRPSGQISLLAERLFAATVNTFPKLIIFLFFLSR